jgi:hypothetical protein
MKTIKHMRITIIIAGLITVCTSLAAQNKININPPAPHGGEIKISNNYFIELLFSTEDTYVYVFDKHIKPIENTGIDGKIIFKQYDSTMTTIGLEPYRQDGFIAKTSVPAYSNCTVYFNIRGKRISTQFDHVESVAESKK